MRNEELIKKSKTIRKKIFNLVTTSKASHIGSMFSCVDLLVYLYYHRMNFNKKNYTTSKHDRLILSKGHASLAIYTILNDLKIISDKILNSYYQDGGKLMAHMDSTVSGVEVSAGSLGHGLSVAIGIAIGLKTQGNNAKVYCILGDGECNEGSVWEAIIFLSRINVSNLVVIIDANKIQGYDHCNEICKQDTLKNMLNGTDLNFYEINGHSFVEMKKVFEDIDRIKNRKAHIIFANTIKGKGVSFMENKLLWHYHSPDKKEYKEGLKEL